MKKRNRPSRVSEWLAPIPNSKGTKVPPLQLVFSNTAAPRRCRKLAPTSNRPRLILVHNGDVQGLRPALSREVKLLAIGTSLFAAATGVLLDVAYHSRVGSTGGVPARGPEAITTSSTGEGAADLFIRAMVPPGSGNQVVSE